VLLEWRIVKIYFFWLNFFFMFLDCFDVFISKINFKNYMILMHFWIKNTLKITVIILSNILFLLEQVTLDFTNHFRYEFTNNQTFKLSTQIIKPLPSLLNKLGLFVQLHFYFFSIQSFIFFPTSPFLFQFCYFSSEFNL
jgi:hypothetical protein